MVISPGNQLRSTSTLLWRSVWRYVLQRRWQSGLNILGILIGVMMVVAVDLANNSARQAFDDSIDILNGSITHQIVGGSDGVPDAVYTRLKTELGIARAAPALGGQVRIHDDELTLIGLDLLSERTLQRKRPGLSASALQLTGNLMTVFGSPRHIVLPEKIASQIGLAEGDTFTVASLQGVTEVTLAATFAVPGDGEVPSIMFADIAGAQAILGREGRINSIDMILDEADVLTITNWLPVNLALVTAEGRNDSTRQMSDAFHVNLLAMSLLSLLVAGLLIYNTVTLSVIQRWQTLGIFRAEGVTGGQVFRLVLIENALTGLIASLLGVVAGYLLGRFLVTMVTATVDALYLDLAVSAFRASPVVLIKGLVLGVVLSLLSALLPAWYASRAQPITLQHQGVSGEQWIRRIPWLALLGLCFLLAGWVMLLPDYGSLVIGFVALTLMVFGYCLCVPLCLYGLLGVILHSAGRWLNLATLMALRNTRMAINRSGLAVAALCVAVSVTVGVGVMIGSFRGTVILWLEQSLPGDIQLTAVSGPALATGMPATLKDDLVGLSGITAAHNSVLGQVESNLGRIRLGVNDIPAEEKFYLKDTTSHGVQAFNNAEGVFVSEPLAYLNHLSPGDSLTLLTDSGEVAFPIVGIFHDYTSGSGMVHMHEKLYSRYWEQRPFSRMTLETAPAVDDDEVLVQIEQRLDREDSSYNLISNRQLRDLTLRIFDRTFAITRVLRMLAILVAFVGVVSTLMALQLEKGREFAILWATGMTPGGIAGLILQQTIILGLCAGLLALPLGLLMSDILIDVINRRSFGWSMQHFLPESVLVEGFVLALVAAVLAGIYPAWRAGKISTALALREE